MTRLDKFRNEYKRKSFGSSGNSRDGHVGRRKNCVIVKMVGVMGMERIRRRGRRKKKWVERYYPLIGGTYEEM